MNLLIITVCILIETTVIIAETEMLLATNSPTIMRSRNRVATYSSSNLYPNQFAVAAYPSQTQPPILQPLMPPPSIPPMPLYNYNYNTDTGIQAQEKGYLNNAGTYQEALEVLGSYSYTDNEGNTFQVSYIANEDGFQPKGAHLPTVPPLIEKALQYIEEHSEDNEKE